MPLSTSRKLGKKALLALFHKGVYRGFSISTHTGKNRGSTKRSRSCRKPLVLSIETTIKQNLPVRTKTVEASKGLHGGLQGPPYSKKTVTFDFCASTTLLRESYWQALKFALNRNAPVLAHILLFWEFQPIIFAQQWRNSQHWHWE
jgi:hypothetical protein